MQKNIPGMLVCLLIAIPAWLLGEQFEVVGGPVFAILIGMIIALFWKEKGHFKPGMTFASKKILQYAVILLGFGLDLVTIGQVGWRSMPIILSTITVSLVISFVLYKAMHMPKNISTLIGVGSSICGGSAIAATAPVIGADDEEIAQSISVIFLFNVAAAIIFPSMGGMLGLTNEGFGIFAGTAVNDTSSVTAAASTWDTLHKTGGLVLEYATIVKLTRTLAIIPITLVLASMRMRAEKQTETKNGKSVQLRAIFPMFILYFVLASVITTVLKTVCVGETLEFVSACFSFLKKLSKFFIVIAMAAIGLNTDIIKLVKTGGKPIFMGFCCWVSIACVSLVMQHLLGIF